MCSKRLFGVELGISTSGGLASGVAAVDLDQIPVSAIERVEVLRDGAAAQYGSDAIAGVLNIILKSSPTDGSLELSYGRYHDSEINPHNLGNGRTRAISASKGFRLDRDGFVNVAGELRDKLHTNQTGPELRTTTIDPYASRIIGDSAYDLGSLSFNAGKPLNAQGLEAFAFGTFSSRQAESWQNQRLPNNPTFAGLVEAGIYTQGFAPLETTHEQNRALAAGARGRFGEQGRWEASVATGGDTIDLGLENTVNVDLFRDTGSSPYKVYIGQFANRQTTANLDGSQSLKLAGLPLDLAAGLEAREERYSIKAGDYASTYKGGTQAFVGLSSYDEGEHKRRVGGVYADATLRPAAGLQFGVAVRTEHYNDFGSTTTGKLSARWDASPTFAVRGTFSNGYRAPNLAEQYFSSTLVTPTYTYVQLQANSAAAQLAGAQPLKPEKSTNLSLGLVATPWQDLNLTADAYRVRIRDRIVLKTGISGSQAQAAVEAAGIVAQPGTSSFFVNYFANGVDTTTTGLDLTAQTRSRLGADGALGQIRWTLAGNFKHVSIDRADPSYSIGVLSPIRDSTPKHKVVGSAHYSLGGFNATVRVTHYGETSQWTADGRTNGAPWYRNVVKPAFIVDLEGGYEFENGVSVALGVNNIANKYPDRTHIETALPNGASLLPAWSPYGINGAYYHASVAWRF
jgi:iron complex outermembrane recepter protein